MSRISIGALGFTPITDPGYLGVVRQSFARIMPPGSTVTLIDGTVIDDPAATQAEFADCHPYMCGADPQNQNARLWCAFFGQAGNLAGCADPSCEPYRSHIPSCTLPTAPSTRPAPAPVTLTPQNIVQPLPDITAILAPTPAPAPQCSGWSQLNAAISAHPLLSAAALAGLALVLWPKGNR